MRKIAYCVGVLVMSLSSCSVEKSNSGNGLPNPVPTTTSLTSPSSDNLETPSLEAAGERYLEIVQPVNCAIVRYGDLETKYQIGAELMDPSHISEYQNAMRDVASSRKSAVRELVLGRWPESVAAEINDMSIFWSSLQTAESALSQVADLEEWNLAMNRYKELFSSSEGGLAKVIRIKLGVGDFDRSSCG